MPKLKLTETVLRDGQQSLAGARMTTEEMLPILPTLDRVGYHSAEVFGGATFDACLRHLNEDPWSRLYTIRSNMPHTKLQMTLRGQSLVGYRHYPDDIIQYFVQKSVANGIDIVRVYDPLNDARNVETAVRAAKREGAHVQGALCYTTSPVHSSEHFVRYAGELLSLGVDSICIKDMAGILRPYEAYQLIKALRSTYASLSIQLHTHDTAGMAAMTVLKAVEVGVDVLDTAISPFAYNASLAATESVASAFMNTPYVPEVDMHALSQASEYFSALRARYLKDGRIPNDALHASPSVLSHQLPGGMYYRTLKELCDFRSEGLFEKVLEEIPAVRADAGYVPLVTPTTQIIAMQALHNVLDGERYRTITDEFKDLIGGKYGKTPAPITDEIRILILGEDGMIASHTVEPEPGVELFRNAVSPYAEQEEDLLTLALFDKLAIRFFEWRKNQRYRLDRRASRTSATHPV